jgi:succinoglycan biosynthesis protein ExoA
MTDKIHQEPPLVSVVLAVFNEAGHVQKCMDSLLAQETPGFDIEILAVDGGSTDGTKEYLDGIAAKHPHVRVLLNQQRRAPFAFNIGIREARGQYVCIFCSHTIYRKDYISVCLKELLAKGAAGCGGRVLTEPSSDKLGARLVAYGMAHPFGSSRKSFRTQPEGFADAVNYMVIRRDSLIEAGGYSEVLLRNQDNDLNQKLCVNGHRLFCTWKTQCIYHPKGTIRDLFRYGYLNGFWNVISFKENPASMGLRHFVPFFFLVGLLVSILLSIAGLLSPNPPFRFLALSFPALLALHLGLGTLAALQVSVQKNFLGALWLPFVFLGFHFAYGLGSLVALLKGARAPKSSPSSPAALHRVPIANDVAGVLAHESQREESA